MEGSISYDRWDTFDGTIKLKGKPTTEQEKAVREINTEREKAKKKQSDNVTGKAMISLQEAKKKAEECLKGINRCTEYSNAYVFTNPWSNFSFGGEDSPVVVLKGSGRIVNMTTYIDTMAGEMIREMDV